MLNINPFLHFVRMSVPFDDNDLQDIYVALRKAMVPSSPYFMEETLDFGMNVKWGELKSFCIKRVRTLTLKKWAKKFSLSHGLLGSL